MSTFWNGRFDGDTEEHLRIFQIVTSHALADIQLNTQMQNNSYQIIGFRCDEGVRRNKGWMGARDAPDTIRQAIANLPYTDGDNHLPTYCLNDSGEIICQGNDLETAQKELADGVGYIIKNNHTPIILGGGHETAFGVFRGLHQAYPIQTRIGVLNFDAHFDLRTTQDNVPTSGTPFYDVYALCAKEGRAFTYFCVGIAPGGVSALNPMGIHPALGEQCIIELLNHDIVIAALDVVEVNLKFDPDNITAKLASRFVYTFMT